MKVVCRGIRGFRFWFRWLVCVGATQGAGVSGFQVFVGEGRVGVGDGLQGGVFRYF